MLSRFFVAKHALTALLLMLSFVVSLGAAHATVTISSFSPNPGPVGSTVTIAGTGFTGATSVKFNGTSATTYTVSGDTSISVTVPTGATTGVITVTSPSGTANSSVGFHVLGVTSFSPAGAAVGATVTITGTSFQNPVAATAVKFNGTAATYSVTNDTTISATVPSGATTGSISVTSSGGTASSATNFSVLTAPTITSFTPTSGYVGQTVTISGTSFTGATAVAFNGTAATFSVTNNTTISATVPSGATTGTLSVTTPLGTATSSSSFTMTTAPAPSISSIGPNPGPVGATITVNGAAFTGATSVKFNGTTASYTVVSDSTISTTVPSGATTGVISVTTPQGTGSSSVGFHVLGVTSFTPTTAAVGATVTITGTSFQNPVAATAVKFNGTAATYSVTNDTTISATVPSGVTTGLIGVTSAGGTAYSSGNFTVPTTITSFGPNPAPVGVTETIHGTGFTGATSVKFNGTSSTYTVVNDTTITATVPSSATTGVISVTSPGGTASSSTGFHLLSFGSFTPTSGPIGTTVTITGTSFQNPVSATAVKVNGTSATFSVTNDTTISATVPNSALSGPVSVTSAGGTVTSGSNFSVTPSVTSFTPTSGVIGTSVSITGGGFTSDSVVMFNGTVSTSVTVNSPTSITASVPTGSSGVGPISVTNTVGSGSSATNFTIITIPAAPTGLAATPGNAQVSLSWTAPTGVVDSYTVKYGTVSGGPYPNSVTVIGSTSTTITGLTNNTPYYFVVTATNTAGTSPNSASVSATPSLNAAGLRVDSGSTTAFTDAASKVWTADQGYTGGSVLSTAHTIAGTSDAALYQLQRSGSSFSYSLPMPNGYYTLDLLFAEIDPAVTAAGQRMFSVSANGSTVLSAFDIYAACGNAANTAITKSFLVNVTAGQVNLSFVGVVGNPAVAAIRVLPLSAGTPATDDPAPGWATKFIPSDQSDASGSGPSSSESVVLPSGVKENSPGSDLEVFNPVGPSVSFTRLYRSAFATAGLNTPGLSPGWVDNYDLTVTTTTPGTWGTLKLNYPNGAQETWTPTVTGSTATFTHPSGVPYLVTGVPSSTTGVWQSLTMTMKDRSTFTFKLNPNASSTTLYPLSQIGDVANRVVNFNYDSSRRLTSVVNDDSPATTLLAFSYTSGLLSTITDPYSRQITYGFGTASDPGVTGSVLTTVSQIGSTNTQWQYDYAALSGKPLLNLVKCANPTGTGVSSPAGTIYDANGHVLVLKDANGNYRTYSYNSGYTLVSVYSAAGNLIQQWKQNYNPSNHNVGTGVVDGNGNSSAIAYTDSANPYRATSVLDKNSGNTPILLQYDAYGNPSTVTDPRSVVTTNTPDSSFPLGQVSSIQVGSKTSTKFTYYSGSTVVGGVTQPNGLVKTVFTPTPGTSGSGTWVQTDYVYTALGDVATVTKPAPNSGSGTVTYAYNYTYDPGDSAHSIGSYGQSEKHGQPLTVTAPSPDGVIAGAVTHFRYDIHGNLTTVISPLGNQTDYLYTAVDDSTNADQLVKVVYPATGTGAGRAYTTINYRYPGGPIASVDIYDESGALVRHADRGADNEGTDKLHSGDIQPSAANYDPRYRPTQILNGATQAAKTVTYDDVTGNAKKVTFPLGDGPQVTQFDPADNILIGKNGRGQTTTVTRATDDGRATDLTYSSGTLPAVHYTFDVYNRITQVTDGTGTVQYAYDDDDRVTSVITTYLKPDGVTYLAAKTVSYVYNTDGTRASMTTPSAPTFTFNGGKFTYSYDNDGRLTSVNTPWVASAMTYTYDADDRVIKQHTNRADTFYTYNQRGWPTEVENVSGFSAGSYPDQQTTNFAGTATPTGKPLLSDYSNIKYDAEGNRTQMTFYVPNIYTYSGSNVYLYAKYTSGIIHYAYDNQGRLHQEYTSNADGTATLAKDYMLTSSPLTYQYNVNYNYTFNYDAAGNRTTANSVLYNTDGTNQSSTVNFNANDQPSDTGYTHDLDGNPTTYKGISITYNIRDEPTNYNSGALTMAWNSDGQRAWKDASSVRTYFLYDGDQVITELDTSGRVTGTYGYGACGLFQDYQYDYSSSFGRYVTYCYNPAGSVTSRIRSDVTASICDDVAFYDTFGQLHSDFYTITGGSYLPSLKDPIGFAGQFGQYTDLETQGISPGTYLSLSGPELYDPNLGRHLVRSGGLNEYQAQALPYTVLSSMGKGFLNAGVSGVVGMADLALTSAQLVSSPLDFGRPIYHIPDRFYTPFTVGNSQIERVSGAMGEFSFYALSSYLAASGEIRGGFGAARAELSVARKVGNCFVAGTLVQMADGTTKPIEQVQIGEFVQSRDPSTGITEAKRVTATFKHRAPQVLTLSLADAGTGEIVQTLTCTPGHPFYVDGKGFVLAGDLAIGTSIVTRAGPDLIVADIEWHTQSDGSPQGADVYNFTVEADHTYFVGAYNGGIWVHNNSRKIKYQPTARPDEIRYSQNNINHVFTDPNSEWSEEGLTLDDAIAEAIKLGKLPAGLELNVVDYNGEWVALNNRTLYIAQMAKLKIVPITIKKGGLNEAQRKWQDSGLYGPLERGLKPEIRIEEE